MRGLPRIAKESLIIGRNFGTAAAAFDPSRVVVVCISGYQFSSSIKEDTFIRELKEERRAQALKALDISMAELKRGSASAAASASSEALLAHMREKAIAEIEATQEASVQSLLKMLSGGTGMETLRNKIADDAEFRRRGVKPENIIYHQWSERSPGNPRLEPTYDGIRATIDAKNPSFLIIVGHSYGGCTAARLSRATTKKPNAVFLIDPIFAPADMGSDTEWECHWSTGCQIITTPYIRTLAQSSHSDNFPRGAAVASWYQTASQPLGFKPVKDDSGRDVRNEHVSGVDHTTIDDHRSIHNEIINLVRLAIGRGLVSDAADESEKEGSTAVLSKR